MKNIFSSKVVLTLLSLFLLLGTSCKKMFDLKPETELDQSNAYLTVADADAAVFGIYGKFVELSKQYIILNELRADLLSTTNNADPYLREISEHRVTKGNPYASPKKFYELINDCNDALKNFQIMRDNSRMSVDDFNKRFSDIGALRSWIYLQLGIHFGKIPYITKPLENVDQLSEIAAEPRISFTTLIDTLIKFNEALPYKAVWGYPDGSTLSPIASIDGNSLKKIYITKYILLGELYLWKNKYEEAAKSFRIAMDADVFNDGGVNYFSYYRVAYSATEVPNSVVYSIRGDTTSLNTGLTGNWRGIFAQRNTDRGWNGEWYWSVPYSFSIYNNRPRFPFNDLFYSTTYGGSYLLKPSNVAFDYWRSQTAISGIPYDPRMKLSTETDAAGNVYASKMTDSYLVSAGGQWNIWRAAGLHLKFSEAANRDGKTLLAWALVNIGIKDAFSPNRSSSLTEAELNRMITPYSYPYSFDARDGGTGGVKGPWYRNTGIRNRGYVTSLGLDLQTNQLEMENKIIDEAALELAFEGTRWADLLRIAMRRDDNSFIANKVYNKLSREGNSSATAARDKLNVGDWFLPFE